MTAEELKDFCVRWKISELALFGSVLRPDFRDDSDIDVLISYRSDAKRGLFEKIDMKEELEALVSRKVDLVSKKAVERSRNWIRRQNILESAEILYAE
ncbi:nucleotidyltransferase domain-containing protein [cf. Phormidesmis sp. LEGE 11477]|nr:nucleotidyltransferase domain-containing protein [cf. Phormidesmis sp. LEGE 11477]